MDRRTLDGWVASLAALAALATAVPCTSQTAAILELTLELGAELHPGPIEIVCSRPAGLGELPVLARTVDGTWLVIDPAPSGDDARPRCRLRWLATRTLPGGTSRLRAEIVPTWQAPSHFQIRALESRGDAELRYRGRPIWRRRARFDPADFDATYKPFHELFACDGRTLVTKGTGGEFPHHRGLFVGWNQTRAGESSYDFWHCRDGVHQQRVGGSSRTTPCFAETVDLIEWRSREDQTIVRERRELTTWCASPSETVLDLEIGLAAGVPGEVILDGDPQHAGVQVRLAGEVHDRAADTVYARDPKAVDRGNDVWADCRFARITARVGEQTIAVTHALQAGWPGDALYSTRAYGRFGATARLRLEPGRETILRTRWVLECGETAAQRPLATRREPEVLGARLAVAR